MRATGSAYAGLEGERERGRGRAQLATEGWCLSKRKVGTERQRRCIARDSIFIVMNLWFVVHGLMISDTQTEREGSNDNDQMEGNGAGMLAL